MQERKGLHAFFFGPPCETQRRMRAPVMPSDRDLSARRLQSAACARWSCFLLMTVCGLAAASNSRDIQRAVATTRCWRAPASNRPRPRCASTARQRVIETDDPPEFFDCVYVQTSRDLNLFSLEDGYLMSELQLTLANMDGVALQRMGRYVQVQIFSGNRVTALYHPRQVVDRSRPDRGRLPLAAGSRRARAPAAPLDRALTDRDVAAPFCLTSRRVRLECAPQ